MLTYTLIVMMSAINYSAEYRAGGALTSYTVPGFTTEQACKNAKAAVLDNSIGGGSITVRMKAVCVASDL